MRRNNVRIHPQRQSESNESRKQPTACAFAAKTQNRPRCDKSSRSDPAMLDELKGHAQRQALGPDQRGRTGRAKRARLEKKQAGPNGTEAGFCAGPKR